MKVLVIGADVDAWVNGSNIGRVTSVEFGSITERIETYGIDVQKAQELKAGKTYARFRMQVLRTIGDGGAQGMGAVAQAEDTSIERYATVLLRDRRSDQPIFSAGFCQVESENWTSPAKDLLRGVLDFKVIDWGNEAST